MILTHKKKTIPARMAFLIDRNKTMFQKLTTINTTFRNVESINKFTTHRVEFCARQTTSVAMVKQTEMINCQRGA